MNIRNKDILNCFPLLASVLGNRYGVEIRMGGDKAMTDGKIIYLPAMPAELDNETLEAAKGFVDHESAHIRYTDFGTLQNAKLDKLEHWLFNAIEDWRVEQLLANTFPGCGQNFQKLIKRMFGTPTKAGPKNPAFVVLDYVLLSVRSWAVSDVIGNKNQAGEILDDNFAGLRYELDLLLGQVQQSCPTTDAAIIHAKKIGICIKKYVNSPPADEQNNCDNQNSSAAQNQQENQVAEKGCNSAELNPSDYGCETEQADGGEQKSTFQSGQDSEENDTPQSASGMGEEGLRNRNDSEKTTDQEYDLDTLLAGNRENLPPNLGQMLADTLENSAADENSSGIVIATIGDKAKLPFLAEERMEALRDSAALRQRFAGLLQARTFRQGGTGRHGKLDAPCLHRLCVGNARVFRRETERIALDAAVHILLDCSSSMTGASMSIARKACYAIVKSLANIRGVNLALTAFPAECVEPSVYPAIRHGQAIKEMPSFCALGDTPLGPALWWVMREMLPLKENRKIILILTDGVPTSVKAARRAISQCQKLKMEVMGIGIQSTSVSHLLPKSSKVIWKLNELAPAMFELMKNTLLMGGQR